MKEKNGFRASGGGASPRAAGKGWISMLNALEAFRKRKFLVLAAFLIIFAALCGFQYVRNLRSAGTVLSLDYEEASKGLTPNRTRFNIFEIRSGAVMERLIAHVDVLGVVGGYQHLIRRQIYKQRRDCRKIRGGYAFASLQGLQGILCGALRIQPLHPFL